MSSGRDDLLTWSPHIFLPIYLAPEEPEPSIGSLNELFVSKADERFLAAHLKLNSSNSSDNIYERQIREHRADWILGWRSS